jgi:hypothetical protein
MRALYVFCWTLVVALLASAGAMWVVFGLAEGTVR